MDTWEYEQVAVREGSKERGSRRHTAFKLVQHKERSRPTNNQLLYKAYFRWQHYPFKIRSSSNKLPTETDACASVTSAFLQVLHALHLAETLKAGPSRNILQILSTNTRRTKVVELSTGTHRVPEELKKHYLSDGEDGQYSTNLDRNRYGNDDQYLFTVIRYDLEYLGLCPCMCDVEIIDAKNDSQSIFVSAGPEACLCGKDGYVPGEGPEALLMAHAHAPLMAVGRGSSRSVSRNESPKKSASQGMSQLFDALVAAATGNGALPTNGEAPVTSRHAAPPLAPQVQQHQQRNAPGRQKSRMWSAMSFGDSLQNALEQYRAQQDVYGGDVDVAVSNHCKPRNNGTASMAEDDTGSLAGLTGLSDVLGDATYRKRQRKPQRGPSSSLLGGLESSLMGSLLKASSDLHEKSDENGNNTDRGDATSNGQGLRRDRGVGGGAGGVSRPEDGGSGGGGGAQDDANVKDDAGGDRQQQPLQPELEGEAHVQQQHQQQQQQHAAEDQAVVGEREGREGSQEDDSGPAAAGIGAEHDPELAPAAHRHVRHVPRQSSAVNLGTRVGPAELKRLTAEVDQLREDNRRLEAQLRRATASGGGGGATANGFSGGHDRERIRLLEEEMLQMRNEMQLLVAARHIAEENCMRLTNELNNTRQTANAVLSRLLLSNGHGMAMNPMAAAAAAAHGSAAGGAGGGVGPASMSGAQMAGTMGMAPGLPLALLQAQQQQQQQAAQLTAQQQAAQQAAQQAVAQQQLQQAAAQQLQQAAQQQQQQQQQQTVQQAVQHAAAVAQQAQAQAKMQQMAAVAMSAAQGAVLGKRSLDDMMMTTGPGVVGPSGASQAIRRAPSSAEPDNQRFNGLQGVDTQALAAAAAVVNVAAAASAGGGGQSSGGVGGGGGAASLEALLNQLQQEQQRQEQQRQEQQEQQQHRQQQQQRQPQTAQQ